MWKMVHRYITTIFHYHLRTSINQLGEIQSQKIELTLVRTQNRDEPPNTSSWAQVDSATLGHLHTKPLQNLLQLPNSKPLLHSSQYFAFLSSSLQFFSFQLFGFFLIAKSFTLYFSLFYVNRHWTFHLTPLVESLNNNWLPLFPSYKMLSVLTDHNNHLLASLKSHLQVGRSQCFFLKPLLLFIAF